MTRSDAELATLSVAFRLHLERGPIAPCIDAGFLGFAWDVGWLRHGNLPPIAALQLLTIIRHLHQILGVVRRPGVANAVIPTEVVGAREVVVTLSIGLAGNIQGARTRQAAAALSGSHKQNVAP